MKYINKGIDQLNKLYEKKIKEQPHIHLKIDKKDPEEKFIKCIITYNKDWEKKALEENIYLDDINIIEEGIKFIYNNNYKETKENIQLLNEEIESYFFRYNKIRNLFNKFNDKND